MVGRLVLAGEKGRFRLEEDRLGPLEVVRAVVYAPEGLPPWRLRWRLRRAERALVRAGAGRVVLDGGFPYGDRLALLRPVDPLPFFRGCADVLALGALEAEGVDRRRGRVALSAPRLCAELERAADRRPGGGGSCPVSPAQVWPSGEPALGGGGRDRGVWSGWGALGTERGAVRGRLPGRAHPHGGGGGAAAGVCPPGAGPAVGAGGGAAGGFESYPGRDVKRVELFGSSTLLNHTGLKNAAIVLELGKQDDSGPGRRADGSDPEQGFKVKNHLKDRGQSDGGSHDQYPRSHRLSILGGVGFGDPCAVIPMNG